MPEEHRAETDGFNTPPVDMTRAQRQRFRSVNRKLRKKMGHQVAYYEAFKAAMAVKS